MSALTLTTAGKHRDKTGDVKARKIEACNANGESATGCCEEGVHKTVRTPEAGTPKLERGELRSAVEGWEHTGHFCHCESHNCALYETEVEKGAGHTCTGHYCALYKGRRGVDG